MKNRALQVMQYVVPALMAVIALFGQAIAQTERVIYSFTDPADGMNPYAGLVIDSNGNLYGTTQAGGAYGFGTVFEVSAIGTKKTLYSFGAQSGDGMYPDAGLVRDGSGNLYGTTHDGGEHGFGTAYKVTKSGKETVLYSFGGFTGDGNYPFAGLVRDSKGNLYGTANSGGEYGYGTVFMVTPLGTETLLHSFDNTDGASPWGGLVFDKSGNLYGTTFLGGSNNLGVVFQVSPSGEETVLYNFSGPDGKNPNAGVILDAKGHLYGTTQGGGSADYGTVFEVTSSGTEKVLYNFHYSDGANPMGKLIRDAKGNIFGTTYDGGTGEVGTVFEVTHLGVETVLHNFTLSSDGDYPVYVGLVSDKSGNLYGTTSQGGNGYGTVFEVTP